jgi:hypothetical protein
MINIKLCEAMVEAEKGQESAGNTLIISDLDALF